MADVETVAEELHGLSAPPVELADVPDIPRGAAAGGIGALIARSLGQEQARVLEEQLATGGLVLWVRVRSPDREQKAPQILKDHEAEAVGSTRSRSTSALKTSR
jgi:hypothetical protein